MQNTARQRVLGKAIEKNKVVNNMYGRYLDSEMHIIVVLIKENAIVK